MTPGESRVSADRIRWLQARLLDHYGSQHWWPGDSAFEVLAGTILVQRTRWRNAELALTNLRQAGLLTPDAVAAHPVEQVENLIRPAGFYRQKARRLRSVSQWVTGNRGIEQLRSRRTGELRQQLLAMDGIGPETADCILLYVFHRPVFVADAYARRLFHRLGWQHGSERDDYDALAGTVQDAVNEDAEFFNEFHALIVAHGKSVCGKSPRCRRCVLRVMCSSADPGPDATGHPGSGH
jgi:endonuclease-3 related protein